MSTQDVPLADVLTQDGPQIATEDKPDAETTTAKAQEAGGETDETPEGEEKPKRKGGWQRKIERLEKQNEMLLEALHSGRKPEATEEKPTKKPKMEDFSSFDEYLDARDAWVKAEAKNEVMAEVESKITVKDEQTSWSKKLAAARDAHDDFDEVLATADVAVTPAMHKVIMRSDDGAELAYFLGKNPTEAQRIANLPPEDAAYEMGKISVRLAGEKPKAKVAEKSDSPATKAPKPPTPVKAPSKTTQLDPDNPEDADRMTPDEWLAARNKKLAGK